VKVALIGYGAMGQLVAAELSKRGDELGSILTSKGAAANAESIAEKLAGHDAAIDFSVAEAVPTNVQACMLARVPLVEGTTGWKNHASEVKRIVAESGGALVVGANFSIGVNLFYRIVKNAADLFSSTDGYAPFIEEAHHSRKRDAPSGTALRIREIMSESLKSEIPTSSTRAGYIPGTHRVGFDSEADQILLTHVARSRQGFASGAILAAHWIIGREGMFEFSEVIEEVLNRSV
jgi:4-hydroxy-tetrahydrodipicolinate reductase